MLQTLLLSSSVPWDDPMYSRCWALFTVCICFLRILLTFLHRKYYYRPYTVSLFTMAKFLLDYLMLEGVERFSIFSDLTNMRIMTGLEVTYVIMSNYMLYSVFYGNFVLPSQAIIQFSAVNLVSVGVAVTMLILVENRIVYLVMIIVFHTISFSLYCDKSIGLIKCRLYNPTGTTLICITMLFHFIFNHFLRVIYLYHILFDAFHGSLSLDRLFYLAQVTYTFLLISYFILYRLQNTDRMSTVLVMKRRAAGMEARVEGFGSDFMIKEAADELMYPKDNDLNTISDGSSIGSLDEIMDLPQDICLEGDPFPSPRSEVGVSVFTTRASGRRLTIHILRNKVTADTGRRSIQTMSPA